MWARLIDYEKRRPEKWMLNMYTNMYSYVGVEEHSTAQ